MRILVCISLVVVLMASASSCKKCSTCNLVQDGVVLGPSIEDCKSKDKIEEFKKRMEQNNALLDYANAIIVCTDKQ